ncbi:MAG: hypothetical protein HN389_10530 [Clostridia bacterium]|jgi:hypothetical protein|nr:hypothetical protein [Clostridia bacterium]
MERVIKVNGQDTILKPSANFMFYYRNARLNGEEKPDFQMDLKQLAGMEKLQDEFGKIDSTNALDILQKTNIFEFSAIIRRMLWTFAYTANKSILPFEEWCDALQEYDAVQASKTVMELVNDNFFLMLGVAKPREVQSL